MVVRFSWIEISGAGEKLFAAGQNREILLLK